MTQFNDRRLFHGTRHDIKHFVRPSKDTDLDNYDYDGTLPRTHRERTFAMSSQRIMEDEPTYKDIPDVEAVIGAHRAESAAWSWSDTPRVAGRSRVYEVEPVTAGGKLEPDPLIPGAVMHKGAMRVKDAHWVPPVAVARDVHSPNWEYVGPGHYQATPRTTASGLDIEDRSQHVQGTLPPLNWAQHTAGHHQPDTSKGDVVNYEAQKAYDMKDRFEEKPEKKRPIDGRQLELFPNEGY